MKPAHQTILPKAGERVIGQKEAVERELLERAKQGSEEAFRALFESHKRRVYLLCFRLTNNQAEAEDLCQEAFLLFFRKLSTFRGESALSTWLHRLVVNLALMHKRRKKVCEIPLEEIDTEAENPIRREYGEPDKRLTETLDRLNLARAIRNLAPGYRAAIVLHDIEGYEHHEIAQLMNHSVGNCKSQLHKARAKLRELLRAAVPAPSPTRRSRQRPFCSNGSLATEQG